MEGVKVGANFGVKRVLVCCVELGHSLCLYLQRGILGEKKGKSETTGSNQGWLRGKWVYGEERFSMQSQKNKTGVSLRDQTGEKGYEAII